MKYFETNAYKIMHEYFLQDGMTKKFAAIYAEKFVERYGETEQAANEWIAKHPCGNRWLA